MRQFPGPPQLNTGPNWGLLFVSHGTTIGGVPFGNVQVTVMSLVNAWPVSWMVWHRPHGRGVPVAAILASTAFGYVTVVMSYVSPDRVFAFLVNSYGTVAIFVYLLIAIAELRLRRRLERESPARLRVRMWGYPWLTRFTIIAMLAVVAAMGVIPAQRVALAFGLVSVAVLLIAYALRGRLYVRGDAAP